MSHFVYYFSSLFVKDFKLSKLFVKIINESNKQPTINDKIEIIFTIKIHHKTNSQW